MSTCVLVVGTPRGGTSCIAGVLHNLGIFVGENLIDANEMNELGFFQDIEFEQLFDDCPDWMPKYPGENICDFDKLNSLIDLRCEKYDTWGLKIKLSAFIVKELEAKCTLKIILICRDRESSIKSLEAWSEESDQSPTEIIDRALEAINTISKNREIYEISYEDLLKDTNKYIDSLCNFLNINEEDKKQKAIEFVKPSLKRY